MLMCMNQGILTDCATTGNKFNFENDLSIKIYHKKTLKNENLLKFQITTKSCMLCCDNFKTQQLLDDHMLKYKQDHKYPTKYVDYLQCFQLKMCINPKENSCFTITIKNYLTIELNIMKIILLHPTNKFIKLFDENKINDHLSFNIDRQLMNSVDDKYTVYIFFNLKFCEVYKIKFSGKLPPIIKISTVQINNRLVSNRPLTLYNLPKFYPQKAMADLTILNFDTKSTNLTPTQQNLLDKLENFRFQKTKLDENNYIESLKTFLEIEDCSMAKKMLDYDKFDQRLESFCRYVKLMIPDTRNHLPRLTVGCEIWIEAMSTYKNSSNKACIQDFDETAVQTKKKKFYGSINCIESNYILIKFENLENLSNLNRNRYRVHFSNNRLAIQLQHNALQFVDIQQLSNLFFPTKQLGYINEENNIQFNWFNKNILENPEQQTAVRNMVAGSCHPAPYILFGPPGTGKTSTLVEAISQLILLKKTSQLLVCAHSNSACNEITTRLLKYNSSKIIIRVFAKMINEDDINDTILDVSNVVYGGHIFPTVESLSKFRIVITTLSVAGRYVQAHINSNFFTHVIIDECGCATEPETLVPIAGLITSMRKLEGNIILAGDPKQLGPVLSSTYSEKLGLHLSMLERLMNTKLYQKIPATNKYDNRYITKLIRNFRSNEHILSVSNKLFYNNELITCGDDELINWSLKWKVLPNRKIPIIFHSSEGNTEKEEKETSFFNKEEIDIVFKYLNLLVNQTINGKLIKEDDIGIISPYNKQCKIINERCLKRGWNNIETGSVEKFQGREKSIIIITLVRSKSRTIGFLNNPKRMNVALTRAQGLLIIVGNIETLQMDKNWRYLIKFCKSNNLVCRTKESLDKLTKQIRKMIIK